MNKKNILLTGLVFFIGLIIVLYIKIIYPKFITTVTVEPKWVNQAQFAGLFVAKERGYFYFNGLNVNIKEFGYESNTLEDLAYGKVDFALTTPETLLMAIDQGADLVAVAAYYQIAPMVIVSLKNSGINSPADFKGKLLGNKGGNIEEDLLYSLMLGLVGISKKDTKIVNIGFGTKEVDDLKMGTADTIDLYRTNELYFFNKSGVKYNLIYPEQFGVNSFSDVLVVKRDLLKEKPQVVKAFVRASIQGWEKALSDNRMAVNDTLKYVTVPEYKDFDYEMYIVQQSLPLIKSFTNQAIGIMETNKWGKIYENMKRSGLIKGNFAIQDVFTNELLQ